MADIKYKKKWNLGLPDSPMLVYYYMTSTGLAPFTVKNNRFHPPTFLGKFYPVLLAAGYLLFISVTFTETVENIAAQNSSPFMKISGTTLYLISLPSVFFTPLIFSMDYKKILYLMNKLCTISHELTGLGIEENHGTFFRHLIMTIVIGNAAIITSCAMLFSMEPKWLFSSFIRYCIDSWFTLHMILIFFHLLICIRERFALINGKLDDLLTPSVSHHSRIFVASRNNPQENQVGSEDLTDLQRIRKIEALHLDLCDLVDRTTHLFAVPILLNIFRSSIVLTLSSYRIYNLFQRSNHRCDPAAIVPLEIVSITYSVLKMATIVVPIFIIAHASTTTCKQGNAMKAVMFKVWICKFKSAELTDEFTKFSNQLLHTTVAVSAFGFMNLNYSLIFKILCTVVTYMIFMVQIEASHSCL